jgi:transglutaminase-like putative cysteine protease
VSRLRIRHVTGFSYPTSVSASYNEARMLPMQDDTQYVLFSQLRVDPEAASHEYVDYWGTRVAAFEILGPHRRLSLTATSVVEVGDRTAEFQGRVPVSWDELGAVAEAQTGSVEQVFSTPSTTPSDDLVDLATSIRRAGDGPGETARAIANAVGERMEYKQGVTSVRTTASNAWEARAGVCQDIAHVTLAAVRAAGIPARYVSGYLHPQPDAPLGVTVLGESHAWVEWLTDVDGQGVGAWTGFDPTNRIDIGERHIVVGRGRDYSDVPPLRGVYAGAESTEQSVTVELTREA